MQLVKVDFFHPNLVQEASVALNIEKTCWIICGDFEAKVQNWCLEVRGCCVT